MDSFKAVIAEFDPHGKFRNQFLTTELYNS
jgi:xylitol oxidase